MPPGPIMPLMPGRCCRQPCWSASDGGGRSATMWRGDFKGNAMIRTFLCAAALAVLATAAAHAPTHAQGRPQIILFQEDNYRGNQLPVDRDVANLTDFRFNDRVSSVRVLGGAWRLCADDYGRGRCITVTHDE